jgi:hypothetical protein
MTRRARDLLGGGICLLLGIVLLLVGLEVNSLGNFARDTFARTSRSRRSSSRRRPTCRRTSGHPVS